RNSTLSRYVTLILLTAMIGFIGYGCNKKGNQQSTFSQTRVSVAVRFPIPIIEAGQSEFYLAQDRGYFARENLEVHSQLASKLMSDSITVSSFRERSMRSGHSP